MTFPDSSRDFSRDSPAVRVSKDILKAEGGLKTGEVHTIHYTPLRLGQLKAQKIKIKKATRPDT
jgi:hypothetical protein